MTDPVRTSLELALADTSQIVDRLVVKLVADLDAIFDTRSKLKAAIEDRSHAADLLHEYIGAHP